ncbi:MAG: hypothetical protein INR71_05650 [Terriglobus roseus]|nr:hypothetical protein [Terriglobus roseus]
MLRAPAMASLSFGIEDDNVELKRLEMEVVSVRPLRVYMCLCTCRLTPRAMQNESPDEFEAWEKLVRAAESQEGGLNRNSAPAAIESTRTIYDRFLAKFPLFFGYWKKYADIEFSIGGTEAAEMVYERGVASITNSVDLWTNYCGFKVETSHEPDITRE